MLLVKKSGWAGGNWKTIVGVVKDFKTNSLKRGSKTDVTCNARKNIIVLLVLN